MSISCTKWSPTSLNTVPRKTRHVEGLFPPIIKFWIIVWAALWEAQLRGEILFVVRHYETFEGGNKVRVLSGFWDLSQACTFLSRLCWKNQAKAMKQANTFCFRQMQISAICCRMFRFWEIRSYNWLTEQRSGSLASIYSQTKWPLDVLMQSGQTTRLLKNLSGIPTFPKETRLCLKKSAINWGENYRVRLRRE